MSGFYLMSRGWMDNDIFGNDEYSQRDAWLWIIEAAAWKPSRARIKGSIVDLERGQLTFSVRFMAEKWRWSKSRVDRFLKRLADQGMIETCTKIGTTAGHPAGQGQSIITVCNYEKYQSPLENARDNNSSQSGTTAGQQRDNSGTKKKEGKEGKEEREDKPLSPQGVKPINPFLVCPEGVDPLHWKDFQAVRRKKGGVNTQTAYDAVLRNLSEFSTDEWPPGRLVQRSAEMNWAKIVNPNEEGGRHGTGNGSSASGRGSVAEALHAARNRCGFG